MKSHIQFLTTPTADTPGTCLLLHFDNKRYLIGNLHEGVQRACTQQGIKLIKVSDVFMTGLTTWKNVGGLLGAVLTLSDAARQARLSRAERMRADVARKEALNNAELAKVKKRQGEEAEEQLFLNVHGGANVLHTFAAARKFIFRQGHPINVYEHDTTEPNAGGAWAPTYSDDNVKVWAVPVLAESPSETQDLANGASRKRSLDEYLEKQTSNKLDGPQDTTEKVQRVKQLQAIVSDMFDSNWRLDALFETPLKDVHVPATIFVRNPETKQIEKYTGPIPGPGVVLPDITVLVRRPWPGALVTSLPPTEPSSVAMSYILRNHTQRGKFLPNKAKELNVKPGPDFRILASGSPVTSTTGQTVHPEDVLTPSKVGSGVVVADIPSLLHVRPFLSRPELKAQEVMEGVESFIWLLGPGVSNDTELQKFISDHSTFKHIISSPDHCANYLAFDSAAAATIRHHRIDPTRFDIPLYNDKVISLPSNLSSCQIADRGLTLHLEPKVDVDTSTVVQRLNTAQAFDQTPRKVTQSAQEAKKEVEKATEQIEAWNKDLPSPDTEIIPLGTGSALPSKYRNVSSTLIREPDSGSYILDCGENTIGQLARLYSPEELKAVFQDIKMIWVSHGHADHHLGLATLIKTWNGVNYPAFQSSAQIVKSQSTDPIELLTEKKKLVVAAEPALIQWVVEYSAAENIGVENLILLEVESCLPGDPKSTQIDFNGSRVGFHTKDQKLNDAMRAATGLEDLAATNVPHCHAAKGVALTFPSGFKISYSGDCRPSKNFVEIGQNSTVLLHEATFDDELKGDAIAKRHSTTSEAIGVGIAMKARRIILTHFSQRYQKLPVMEKMDLSKLELEGPSEADAQNEPDFPIDSMQPSDNVSDMVENESSMSALLGKSKGSSKPKGTKKVQAFADKPLPDLKVAVAFDCMRVKVKDIAVLDKYTPALVKLYEGQAGGLQKSESSASLKEMATESSKGSKKTHKKAVTKDSNA